MDFYQTEIQELRQMMTAFDAGKLTIDQVGAKLAIYTQIEKRAKLRLQSMIVAAKLGDDDTAQKLSLKLLADSSQLSAATTDPEHELIECPALDSAKIERQKCLDYSGSNQFTDCPACHIGLATKNLLLGPKK